jgi:hypothetical protein
MKKYIFLSILALFIVYQSHAQTKHMVIAIVNTNAVTIGKTNNMFITRDDTAQVQKIVDLNPHTRARDRAAGFEIILMQLIQPYYNQGWKLISTSVDAVMDGYTKNTTETYRYYFTKD